MEDDRSSTDETTSTSSSDGMMEFDETITDPMERLLQRSRRERQRELQKIQFSHRPVSSGHQQEKLESFFASTEEASSSNAGQRFRPDSIHLEVGGLYEQQRVTSMLRSLEFRNALEAIVTRHTSYAQTQQPARNVTQAPTPRSSTSSATSSHPRSNPTTTPTPATPPPPPPPPPSTNTAWTQHQTQPSAIQRGPVTQVQARPQVHIPPPPPAPHSRHGPPPPPNAPRSLQIPPPPPPFVPNSVQAPPPPPPMAPPVNAPHQHSHFPFTSNRGLQLTQPQSFNSTDSSPEAWYQEQRDSMVDSIQALLHQHLVTSALNSNFRNVLEIHIQERVSHNGGGEQVQQAVRNLATQFNHSRFRQTQPGHQQTHATASRASVSSHEMTELRSEMEDLKRLMQVSFEMQLGIQRSIQQEVAAVFAAAMSTMMGSANAAVAGTNPRQPATEPRVTSPAEEGTCIICIENATDTVLYRCGHMCVCHACGLSLQRQGQHCPICRAPIVDIVRAYRTT